MKIYNTLTRRKEEFVPITPGEAKIYACGPTVYNFIHIGNARPICVFDVLRRYLEYRGMKVTFVQNFTDIDDKIIRRANEEGSDYLTVSRKYIDEYRVDAAGLNVRPATVHPLATENIGEILSIVKALVEQGHAYAAENGDVYFRTRSDPEYGKLSHQPLEELEAGARIAPGELKEDPMDFALWKAAKPGEPSWPSPWGEGRPGWHIECSAMARRYLGRTIDIHCGGQDLIFPHHENEIAQSECCNGVPFAHYWMHNGYINVDNRKMSKSLGNFFTVRDVAKEYGYEPIRYLMIRLPLPQPHQLQRGGHRAVPRRPRASLQLPRQPRVPAGAQRARRSGGRGRGPRAAGNVPREVHRIDGRRPQHGGRALRAVRPCPRRERHVCRAGAVSGAVQLCPLAL